MTGDELIWYLMIGVVAGWLAGTLVKGSGFGLIGDLVSGILGSVIGVWLFGLFGLRSRGLASSIVVATVGAVVLLWVVRLVRPGRPA